MNEESDKLLFTGAKKDLEKAEISSFTYYVSTIIFFTVTVIGACVIPSVDIIFEFVGVIGVNCMAFLFPAVFYLTASKRYHKNAFPVRNTVNMQDKVI